MSLPGLSGLSGLPGLQLNAEPVLVEEQPAAVHDLPENTEWRFEVAFGESVDVKVRTLLPPCYHQN